MVVVSNGWAKNAAAVQPAVNVTHQFYQQPIVVLDNMVITETQQPCNNTSVIVSQRGAGDAISAPNDNSTSCTGNARAELHCRPNSYHFQKRVLGLQQPAKVGRSVARARAAHDNAIFDCKVLSRHHAILWHEAGKFYLQDTNSSNGTFVNNSRLPSSEAQPHEVNSGDIVQFGVDVVENNKKVTHGCIIATLKLYMADGKEAKANLNITENNNQCVPLDELYKLNQIIQEASQREMCLETKLTALQHIVEQTRKSADESWQAYIGEERLLSRVATLENQLTQSGKNWTDDRLKLEINKLQDEKIDYQYSAKKALEKVHGERLEAVQQATEEQRARTAVEQESVYAKEQLERTQQELQDVAQRLAAEEQRALAAALQSERKQTELLQKLDAETQEVFQLHSALVQVRRCHVGTGADTAALEKYGIIRTDDDQLDDFRCKEDIVRAENEAEHEADLNRSNGPPLEHDSNQINSQQVTSNVEAPDAIVPATQAKTIGSDDSDSDSSINTLTTVNVNESVSDSDDDSSSISENTNNSVIDDTTNDSDEENIKYSSEEKQLDTKTLKYHVQSIRSQYQREMAQIRADAHQADLHLREEFAHRQQLQLAHEQTVAELQELRADHHVLRQRFRESLNECQLLRDRLENAHAPLGHASGDIVVAPPSGDMDALETELVALKERYALLADEKAALNKRLRGLADDYSALCNRSYNTLFYYMAPLVFMVVYLLVSAMLS